MKVRQLLEDIGYEMEEGDINAVRKNYVFLLQNKIGYFQERCHNTCLVEKVLLRNGTFK